MTGTKFGSRKLMLIMAFLLINSYSISYFKLSAASDDSSNPAASVTERDRTKDVVWLVDATSGQCLGPHGDFSECGELTLWIWNKLKKGVSLQSVSTVEEDTSAVHSVAGECLGRRRSLLKSGELAMRRCSEDPFTSTMWKFDEATGMMSDSAGMLSKFAGSVCISNGDSILQSCKEGFTALKRVVFHNSAAVSRPLPESTTQPLQALPGSDSLDFNDVGSWKCPVTGQVFPRNLDQRLTAPVVVPLTSSGPGGAVSSTRGGSAASGSVTGGRQVFMGSGVFSKAFMGMNFNVYSMAWYVEAEAARTDPSLRAFKDRPLSELQSTEAFFHALSSSGRGFDRTLMVKLAMTLKTKMLLDGFLSEIVLQPQNKEAVRRASAAYTPQVCPEGLEIIFTWRVPHTHKSITTTSKHGSAKGSGVDHEYLEVRIGDMYFELHEAGLAEDFMRQFFAPENPVSPSAKKSFVTHFPALLRGARHSPSPSSGVGAGVVDVRTPAAVTQSKSKYAGFFGLRGWKTAA